MTAQIVVAKDPALLVRGYVLAVRRLRQALEATGDNTSDVYIALIEATNWLSSLAHDKRLTSDADVQALGFARDRAHHHWASTIEDDGTGWRWRPAAALPFAEEPRNEGLKKVPGYESRLARKPVLDVFDRLEPAIIAFAPQANLS